MNIIEQNVRLSKLNIQKRYLTAIISILAPESKYEDGKNSPKRQLTEIEQEIRHIITNKRQRR